MRYGSLLTIFQSSSESSASTHFCIGKIGDPESSSLQALVVYDESVFIPFRCFDLVFLFVRKKKQGLFERIYMIGSFHQCVRGILHCLHSLKTLCTTAILFRSSYGCLLECILMKTFFHILPPLTMCCGLTLTIFSTKKGSRMIQKPLIQ